MGRGPPHGSHASEGERAPRRETFAEMLKVVTVTVLKTCATFHLSSSRESTLQSPCDLADNHHHRHECLRHAIQRRQRRRARSRCVHILDHAFWSRSQPRSQSNASNTSSATPKITTGAMSGPRKLSARGQSKGLLSRRLSKATEQAGKVHLPEDGRDLAVDQGGGKGKQRAEESQPPQDVQDQQPKPIFRAKSIIPDPLGELPSWYSTDVQGAMASAMQFRKKYPIHNPMGPRFYKNHHLSPSLDKRPPSVFSPSFPPMAASTDRLPDTAQIAGSSRSSTGSPLPTPSSSQVRIHDVRVRTRKVSLTAHDNVDMLDHTDPWGTNWHHQSPYDVGKGKDRTSPDSPEVSTILRCIFP